MSEQKPYSKAIILLLKKTVEKGSPVWEDIINYQVEIQDYLAVIGLELWMYDSKTRKTKFIGEGFSISHKHNRITIKRASRCINPSAAQSQQHWMIRDHQFDNEGTPLGKSEEYKMR